jgi:hypothetical protein
VTARPPIEVGTRVTNGRPGPARVAGVVVAVKGDTYTVRTREGGMALELRQNLRPVGVTG